MYHGSHVLPALHACPTGRADHCPLHPPAHASRITHRIVLWYGQVSVLTSSCNPGLDAPAGHPHAPEMNALPMLATEFAHHRPPDWRV